MEKFKSERGSATVVTLTVVLFFTIILMGIYVSANNANKAQKNADTTIIDKYGETDYNILIVGHKDSTGMLSAYFENFKVETIYDDYLKLASPNCEYKKYILKK